MQSSTFNMKIYCTIVSVVKYREIFQVYNNNENEHKIVVQFSKYQNPHRPFLQGQLREKNRETKKKNLNNRKMFGSVFTKLKKKSERMAQRKQQPKIERNPCIICKEIIATRRTDGPTMNDFDFMSSYKSNHRAIPY